MATKEQLKSTTEGLNSIPGVMKTCLDIAVALIQSGERVSSGALFRSMFPTEYDRARDEVMAACRTIIEELTIIRRTALSPEAIRATSYLSHVVECWEICPAQNRRNMAERKSFCCLVEEASKEHSSKKFRFKLNRKGQIVAEK